ncbi:MAG: HAMP domain-containing histidine kinase [Lachnospiraceae bacterium]|nr:HAMP domain-containing histidine kinase [Lachnospiraceae bacterium]
MDRYIVLVAVILVGCVVVCLFLKRYYQKRMEAVYQAMLQKLDKAIGGEVQDTVYDESMEAAVVERLNRVVQISGMNQGKAEQERDIIKSLISDISHQVRTPVTNIMLYAGLLQEQDLDSDSMRLADKIQKQSDKLDFFMKELVKSSYAEQEMISIHPEKISVEEILNTACQMVELAAVKKKINIVLEESGTLCFADKKWTTEALGNVLDNAVKYSPENSKVTVGVIPYESFVCIQVKDQGIGIREEEQGMVFERFYRSKDVSGEPGFGIGLYLAREVFSKQGGYVKIKSEIGKGTIVQLYLSCYEV